MTDESLTMYTAMHFKVTVKRTPDLSLTAVLSQDEKPLQTKIPRALLRGALFTSD
ncbi:MAG: hypothetical protein ABIJ50_03140 [Pseudomonadota bacterium]